VRFWIFFSLRLMMRDQEGLLPLGCTCLRGGVLLLKAARQFEPLDLRLARETYLDALAAATFAGRLALGGGMREVAEAALATPPPRPARGPDLLLDGLALLGWVSSRHRRTIPRTIASPRAQQSVSRNKPQRRCPPGTARKPARRGALGGGERGKFGPHD
jgi:hypothetical protein